MKNFLARLLSFPNKDFLELATTVHIRFSISSKGGAPMRCNFRKWAIQAIAPIWPRFFRWSHSPVTNRRPVPPRNPVILGYDIYFESRESPTTIWRLDPIVAAAMGIGIIGQLT